MRNIEKNVVLTWEEYQKLLSQCKVEKSSIPVKAPSQPVIEQTIEPVITPSIERTTPLQVDGSNHTDGVQPATLNETCDATVNFEKCANKTQCASANDGSCIHTAADIVNVSPPSHRQKRKSAPDSEPCVLKKRSKPRSRVVTYLLHKKNNNWIKLY
jgi:hypothetical protein